MRLTIAAVGGLALVLFALGWFVYVRTSNNLLDAVDAGLRSRAELLAGEVRRQGPSLPTIEPTLLESDEAFVQIADGAGTVLRSSAIVSDAPLVPPTSVAELAAPATFDERAAHIDNVARVVALPVEASGQRYVVLVGASLQDRRDQVVELAETMAVAGAVVLVLTGLGAWWLVGATLRPVHEAVVRERRLIDRASHELRTPLAIQRMDLDLALGGPQTTEELAAALRSVSEENDHLSRLADDLLVLSRARDGKLPVRRVEVPLRRLLLDVVARHRARAEAASLALSSSSPDVGVRVDPDRIRQALDDLIDNALRATEAGGRIAVGADAGVGEVSMWVEDSGGGFEDAFLVHAFEPFARDPRRADADGVGLGLTIVRAIAEAHGGTATAENVDGGARVSLTFPDPGVRSPRSEEPVRADRIELAP